MGGGEHVRVSVCVCVCVWVCVGVCGRKREHSILTSTPNDPETGDVKQRPETLQPKTVARIMWTQMPHTCPLASGEAQPNTTGKENPEGLGSGSLTS